MTSMSQPGAGFEWVPTQWGRALRCTAIRAPHFFTTRDLPLRGPEAANGWAALAASLGVAPGALLNPRQVHGADAIVIEADCFDPAAPCSTAADIIMTNRAEVAVAVRTADCVPLLFFDSGTGAVAAAHAGWRGTASRVAGTTIATMMERFGTRPENVVVGVGPSIGPCCYRVGEELLSAFGSEGRRWFYRPAAAELMLNLWAANRDQLAEAGVKSANIHIAELCTAMHPELFDSYRRDGSGTGRLAAAIRTAPSTTP